MLCGVVCLAAGLCRAAPLSTNHAQLAIELFEEGAWQSCRTECARVLLLRTNGVAVVRLLQAVAELRGGGDSSAALTELAHSDSVSAEIQAMAGYELGQHLWRQDHVAEAFTCLETVFIDAPTHDLFLRSGCSLQILSERYPRRTAATAGLQAQLRLCRDLWSSELQAQCDPVTAPQHASLLGRPGQWVIAFYRAQIGPAIGARCSLHPSCSEYGRQALRKHGLLGFSMIADRGFREPGVVANRQDPVIVDGRQRYHDPLELHDYWMDD